MDQGDVGHLNEFAAKAKAAKAKRNTKGYACTKGTRGRGKKKGSKEVKKIAMKKGSKKVKKIAMKRAN